MSSPHSASAVKRDEEYHKPFDNVVVSVVENSDTQHKDADLFQSVKIGRIVQQNTPTAIISKENSDATKQVSRPFDRLW